METSSYCVVRFFALCLCLTWTSRAAEQHLWFGKYPVPYSVIATNGLELGVMGAIGITNSTSTEGIDYNDLYLVFRLSDEYPGGKSRPDYVIVYEPKPEYLARFTLYDSEQRPVKKTALGASYQFKDIPSFDYKYIVPYSRTKKSAPVPIFAKDSWSTGFIELPRISQMFEIKKPGNYRLVLEIQVFHDKGIRNRYVVRFPPLEIPVNQPKGGTH